MSTVFEHRDVDGDTFRVSEWYNPGVLSFGVDPASDSTFANMGRDAVLSLIQALTEWAYPVHTPEGPNRSLIEELIAKAVKDQVAAVLPLHLSPVAEGRCTALLQPGERLMGTHDACGMLWVTHRPAYPLPPVAEHRPQECPGAGQCPEADPEPGDVGHPRPPAVGTAICAGCGHTRDRHRPICAKYTVGKGVCRCDAFQEREPLPVREKTVIVPVCGLCKQPWSDGHGQPGDPCAGVEAARQHPGDWTDALWRVQPSALASESADVPECVSCGHPYRDHGNAKRPCVWASCECLRFRSAE